MNPAPLTAPLAESVVNDPVLPLIGVPVIAVAEIGPVNVAPDSAAPPRLASAADAVAAPVPPCATVSAVVKPVSAVMLAFAPDVAIFELQPKPDPFVH